MIGILMIIYLSILAILCALTIWRFSQTTLTTRFISGFVWLGLATEVTGMFTVHYYGTNAPVYNVSSIIEFVLICLYFNYSISIFRRNYIGYIIGFIGVLAGIATFIVFDSFYKTNSNFLFLECVCILCMSLYAVFELLLLNNEKLQLNRKVQFWIPIILVFYQVGALWSWMMYEYYRVIGDHVTHFLHYTLLINGIITYSSFALLYLFYPRLRHIYV